MHKLLYNFHYHIKITHLIIANLVRNVLGMKCVFYVSQHVVTFSALMNIQQLLFKMGTNTHCRPSQTGLLHRCHRHHQILTKLKCVKYLTKILQYELSRNPMQWILSFYILHDGQMAKLRGALLEHSFQMRLQHNYTLYN